MSDDQIPLSGPDLSDADRAAVLEVLNGRVLSIGPRLEEFETLLAERVGLRYAIAVSSGTAALHLIVRALGWKDGDEVITTPFSFVASANCLLYERVRPVFVDIDPRTRCIDPGRIEAAVTPRTVGIVSVDVFGYPADWDALEEVAHGSGLTLVTDSCESLGTVRATRRGRMRAGECGVAGAFAFYPNKQITTGEGGAVVTDDPSIARLCRSMRNQGRGESTGWLQHPRLGYNYRLSEIAAALGVSQMRRLDDILARRRAAAERYLEWLQPLAPLVQPPPTDPGVELSWFVFVARLADSFTRADRDATLEGLRARGVACANYFSPLHLQPYIADMLGHKRGDFPVSEAVADRTIALPFFSRLEPPAQRRVVDALARELERMAQSLTP